MPRKQPELTNSTIKQIRANQARRCSAILTRVAKFANHELTDNDGNLVTMTQAELKAAQLIRDTCMPAMSEIADVSEPTKSHEQVEKEYQEALQGMHVVDLRTALEHMTNDERKALLESIGKDMQ